MGRSVNKVQLIGVLGREPEIRTMPNGNSVANINLATDESYNDKQTGQKVEQTEWHRVTVYGKLAEICQQYLKKGSRAYFEGKLKTREWEKDGVKRYTTEIVCDEMMLLDRADNAQSQPGHAPAFQQQQQAAYQQGYAAQAPQQQQYAPAPQQPYAQPQQQQYAPAPQQPYAQPQPPQMQGNPNNYHQQKQGY